jgi:hypothetical protein
MKINDLCVLCRQRAGEDGGNIFFKCKYVKQVGNMLGLDELSRELGEMSSTETSDRYTAKSERA